MKQKVTHGEYSNYDNQEISELRDVNKFYLVQTITNSYVNSILKHDDKTLYNIMDPKYISEFSINEQNILDNVNIFDEEIDTVNIEYYKLIIDRIYASEYKEIGTYFVYGKIINTNTEKITDISLIVEMQVSTESYYILPYDYMEKYSYGNIELGTSYKTHLTTINNNSYNECNFLDEIDDYTIILDHMSKLIDELVYDLEDSYNIFTAEYKKEKFDTLGKYRVYISNSMQSIIRSSIKNYKINEYDDYTEYICIDQYGNYYIFQEKGVMDFTVKLDTYTIDTEEFIERYNNSSSEQKTKMNLDKIFQALNRHDYEYIYNKLDNTFKLNNFLALPDFENYMKNTFYNANKVEYGDFSQQSETYIYETKITDNMGENENILEKIFMMKLGEGTDFTISFNI